MALPTYAFGKSATHRTGGGSVIFRVLPRERWRALIPGAHEGYITWPQYEQNQRKVADNACARGADRRLFVPREGPALLLNVGFMEIRISATVAVLVGWGHR